MADTVVSTANRAKYFDKDVYIEYMRQNQYSKFIGTTENSPIQVKEVLGKVKGEQISIPLVGAFKGTNKGTGKLEGNETQISDFEQSITLEVVREAFSINNYEDKVSAFDIKSAGRTQLKNWAMDLLREEIHDALHSRNSVNYNVATSAQHNVWQADNSDRIIYVGTKPSGLHTNDLLTLVAGTDTLTSGTLSLARRKLRTATPKVRPVRTNGQEESFIMFCDSYMFRDLVKDPAIVASRSDAMARGLNNPLFKAGDVLYDGVICIEVPEISAMIDDPDGKWGLSAAADGLNNAGFNSARVGVGFMMGAQALGFVVGKRMKTTTDVRDYGFVKGFGVEEFRKIEKLIFQDGLVGKVDHGVCTIYAAASLD